MDIIITEWALDSYLNLVHKAVFSRQDYKNVLRPDVELLGLGWPSPSPKFQQSVFWGPATDRGGKSIPHAFKMKWRNLGPGLVQLRLGVVLWNSAWFLCQGYVKSSAAVDKRECAMLKRRVNLISTGSYTFRGKL